MRTDSPEHGQRGAEPRRATSSPTRYGLRYVRGPKARLRSKSKGAQEAHEAIRPTQLRARPGLAGERCCRPRSCKLYRLIWQRALASQMADKELETTTVELTADPYDLRASATRTLFDGFSAVYTEGTDDTTEEDERDAARSSRRATRRASST